MPYHFTQPCPTCGRHVRVTLSFLGRTVACQHCHAEFDVLNNEDCSVEDCGEEPAGQLSLLESPLMMRVEAMLQRTEPTRPSPITG